MKIKKLIYQSPLLPVYLSLAYPAWAQEVGKITINKPKEVQVTKLGPLIKSGISIAIILAALMTFAFLVWGGIQWILSGGDKAKYEEARNRITAALIGLAIVVLAWLIIKLVAYFFGLPDPFGGTVDLPTAYEE